MMMMERVMILVKMQSGLSFEHGIPQTHHP